MSEAIVYPKWWLKSKTILFNAASAILLALPFVSDFLFDLADLPEMSSYAKGILFVVNVINIVLRVWTVRPVSTKAEAGV